ncbi:MAG: hypothetical protein VKJ04_05025 [Vampirovibrionales bacterium]|nr:hypothetical protein [Vampirovibrionales bacterium]
MSSDQNDSTQNALMSEPQSNKNRQRYEFDPIIRPGANLNFFSWLFVVGLPLFLLFLIFSKHGV